MGRRSNFERVEKDFYSTPFKAVEPLIPFLVPGQRYIEPCAGDGRLVRHLQHFGYRCVGAFDIEPRHSLVKKADARLLACQGAPMFVTNLPWGRPLFHAIVDNLARQAPLWTLIDAEWVHTKQAVEYLPMLRKIVSVGRVEWIEGSGQTGKDSAVWILLDNTRPRTFCEFHGR